jgi:branched-chain amino acid transport system permease protein
MYSCLALSLNLVIGWSGQFSLGHVTFYGMGAYITTLLVMRIGMNFIFATIISMIAVGIFSAILCLPTIKLRGDYIALVTLGFGEVFRLFVSNSIAITRGPMGIPNIPSPVIFGYEISGKNAYYYFVLLLLIGFIIFMMRFDNSGFGMSMMAANEDDIAATSIGINTVKYKFWGFVIGGMMASIMGSFYSVYMGMIGPSSFDYGESIKMVSMVVLGGQGSIIGSIIGGFVIAALPELLRAFSEYRMVIYGAAMVFMMIFRPEGMWGRKKRKRNLYKLKIKAVRGDKHDKNTAG